MYTFKKSTMKQSLKTEPSLHLSDNGNYYSTLLLKWLCAAAKVYPFLPNYLLVDLAL